MYNSRENKYLVLGNDKRIKACKRKFHGILDGMIKVDKLQKISQQKNHFREQHFRKRSQHASLYNERSKHIHLQIKNKNVTQQKRKIMVRSQKSISNPKKKIKAVFNHIFDPVIQSQRRIQKQRKKYQTNLQNSTVSLEHKLDNSMFYQKQHSRYVYARQHVSGQFKKRQQTRENNLYTLMYKKQKNMNQIKKEREKKLIQNRKDLQQRNTFTLQRRKLIASRSEQFALKLRQKVQQDKKRAEKQYNLNRQRYRKKISRSNNFKRWRVERNKEILKGKYNMAAQKVNQKWRQIYRQQKQYQALKTMDTSKFFKHRLLLNQKIEIYEKWLDQLTDKASILQRESDPNFQTKMSWFKTKSNMYKTP